MHLKEQLLLEHSRANCDRIVAWVGNNQNRFDQLFELFLANEYRVTQRAAQPLRYCVQNHPSFMKGKWETLVDNLYVEGVHDAVIRNTVSLLEHLDFPDSVLGKVAEKCFDYLADPKQAVAIRVFSMSVLIKVVKKEPELIEELRYLIEEHLPQGSTGFKNRGKKVLKALDKLSN